MKLLAVFSSLALLTMASAAATGHIARDDAELERAAAAEAANAKRDFPAKRDTELTARDCSYNTICTCDGRPAGIFCGQGASPRNGWCLRGYVYQCDGHGNTCRYGPRDSCN